MKRYVPALVFLIAASGGIALLSRYTPYLTILELKSYDFMIAVLRGPLPPPDDLVIVAIDESSIQEFSDRFTWPWPRSVHGELIRVLNEAGARAVAFDVVFDLATTAEEDRALAEAIRASRAPVVLAATLEVVSEARFQQVHQMLPIELLRNAGAHIGYVYLTPDSDGALRFARLSVGGEPTLAARTFLETGGTLDPARIPVVRATGDDPEILVNYVGPGRSIPTVSYYQALDYANALPKGIFAGKTVLVGRSLAVQDISEGKTEKDIFASPFDLLMPGVEVHANTLQTLRRGNFLRRPGAAVLWPLIFVFGALISLLVVAVESFRLKILLSFGAMLAVLAGAASALVFTRTWIYTAQPLAIMLGVFVANTLWEYRATERERAHIRRALTGYVSRQVMNEVLRNPGSLELGGVQVQATVLFSDIAGFSKISEGITPRELATMLNDYFSRMGDAIMGHNGMINKYIGDAIMAIWGAPLPDEDHAVLACRAALDMKRIVEGMGGPIRARIGINTGPMVAGNLGHHERMEYTVIGDAVNLASRLEGANKAYGTALLISETTEELVRGKLLVREVDRIRVVGKQLPVRVFELLATPDSVPEGLAAMVRSFEEVLRGYEARAWERTCGLVEEHLRLFPTDSVARAYQARCRKFVEEPPPADWDGVYALEAK
jgi:adenylate cyclase